MERTKVIEVFKVLSMVIEMVHQLSIDISDVNKELGKVPDSFGNKVFPRVGEGLRSIFVELDGIADFPRIEDVVRRICIVLDVSFLNLDDIVSAEIHVFLQTGEIVLQD